MTQPVQEPTQGRVNEGLEFRTRQLFRRPPVASPTPTQSGWTLITGTSDLLTDDLLIYIPIPREFSGWLLYDVEASLVAPSLVGPVELVFERVRLDCGTGGPVSIDSLFSTNITIDELGRTSRCASVPPVLIPGMYLLNEDVTPAYDFIAIYPNLSGSDAQGLMLSIPIGVEQPLGSGEHIP